MCGGAIKQAVDEGADFIKNNSQDTDVLSLEGQVDIATGKAGHKFTMRQIKNDKSERPGETESEKAAADVAAKEYDFARELDFVKDEYRDRVDSLGTDEMQDAVKGTANINAQSSAKDTSKATNIGLQQAGVNPSSGRAVSMNTNVNSSGGEAIGLSQAESSFALDSAHLEGKNNSIAMALGEKTKAVAGLQDIASGANTLAATKARRDFNDKAASNAAIGSAVGIGLSTYKN